jgi:hypothetical protein
LIEFNNLVYGPRFLFHNATSCYTARYLLAGIIS